jgi:hypothetical protein
MAGDVRAMGATGILQELGKLFRVPANDRHVYCVFGPYARLRPFARRLREEIERGSFGALGKVEYLSLAKDLLGHLRTTEKYDEAGRLADQGRDDQLRTVLAASFRDLVTSRLEAGGAIGLVLADFELLYAYDLGGHDLSFARQVAINGRRVCFLIPGAMRDRRLWIFDEDPESRQEFPETLVFREAGWVFELTD